MPSHVEFLDFRCMTIDLRQRQLFAELIPLPFVGGMVDSLVVGERFI
jgi:hypothetical protein